MDTQKHHIVGKDTSPMEKFGEKDRARGIEGHARLDEGALLHHLHGQVLSPFGQVF